MTNLSAARLAACLVTAFVLGTLVGNGPASAIAIPPPPAPPGWSSIETIHTGSSAVPNSMAARADGVNPVAIGTEYDPMLGTYNVVLMSRYSNGWAQRIIATDFSWVNSGAVATTEQYDRAGVFAFVGSIAGPGGVYAGFMPGFSVAGGNELVSDTGGVQSAALAATPEGNVMVVWLDYNGTYNLYGNHSANGAGWDGNRSLVTGDNYIRSYRLIAVGADDFLAVWSDYDGLLFRLWGSVYTGGDGWSVPTEIATPSQDIYGLTAAGSVVAGRGAVAFWSQNDLNATLTLVKHTSVGWWGPEQIAYVNGTGTNVVFPVVAVDGRGTTHLVWGTAPELSVVSDLTYQSEDTSLQWSAPTRLQVSGSDNLQISAADDGGVAISWESTVTTKQHRPFVLREVPGSGWRPAQAVDEVFSPGHSSYALLAVLATGGNYTAMWVNIEDTLYLTVAREFVAGNDPPVLAISAPADGLVADGSTVLVEGTTAPAATVDVDGTAAAVSTDGTFSVRVALANGTHGIVVTAIDQWGNRAQHTVTVTYTDPAPGLEQDLASTQAELAAAQADLQAAHELTHTVQQQAGAASARVENLSAELNASNAVVQHMQTDMDFVKANSGGGSGNLLGILGIVFGLAGVALSVVTVRRGGRPPQAPPESKPNPQPAGDAGAKPSDRAGEARGAAVGSEPAAGGVPLGGAGVGQAAGEAAKAGESHPK